MKSKNLILYIYNIQYPVGQGGLHLGKIYTDKSLYAYIYDCGTINKSEILEKQIDNLLEDLTSSKHDILKSKAQLTDLYIFISHLHQDHVNGLMYLKNKLDKNVKPLNEKIKLYMPYMEEIEKKITICTYTEDENISFEDFKEFVKNPKSYFDDFFKIVYVTDDEKISSEKEKKDGIFFINHNCRITPKHWLLKTFYKKTPINYLSLLEELKSINFNKITEKFKDNLQKKYKEIQEAKKNNLSSLCLYSGLDNNETNPNCIFHTGDINLKNKEIKRKIEEHYGILLKNIKIVQIPHHGSENNSNLGIMRDLFPNNEQLFVTKQKNPKGNKSPKYFSEYANLDKEIKQVTEKSDSIYKKGSYNIKHKKISYYSIFL